MEALSERKQQIADYLSGLEAFEDVTVTGAFPEARRAYPLKNPVITVGIDGAELAPAGLGGYLGACTQGESPLYGANAVINIRFNIYSPSAEICCALYEELCGALLSSGKLGIFKIACDKTSYDTSTAAYLLPAAAAMRAAWVMSAPAERLFDEVALTV